MPPVFCDMCGGKFFKASLVNPLPFHQKACRKKQLEQGAPPPFEPLGPSSTSSAWLQGGMSPSFATSRADMSTPSRRVGRSTGKHGPAAAALRQRQSENSSQPSDTSARIGDSVRAHGLQNAPELNGELGTVLEQNGDSGRLTVKFEGGRVAQLKPANLLKLPTATPQPGGRRKQPAGTLATDSPAAVGDGVRAHGLQNAPELNGTVGTVLERNGESGRLTVEFENGRVAQLKPANLRVVTPKAPPSSRRSGRACMRGGAGRRRAGGRAGGRASLRSSMPAGFQPAHLKGANACTFLSAYSAHTLFFVSLLGLHGCCLFGPTT